jgi:type II secretory pathway pseudopilin PulG
MKFTNNSNKKRIAGDKAFTLIEMLVAMAAFSLVIGSIIGIFISAIRSQSEALISQKLLDDTSYIIEYMSRTIRMAQKEEDAGGPTGCLSANGLNYESAGNNIKFKNMYGDCQEFYLGGTDNKQLIENRTGIVSITNLPLNSDDLQITSLRFIIAGDALGQQPKVTISLIIKPKTTTAKPEINIQTTIAQRNLNI